MSSNQPQFDPQYLEWKRRRGQSLDAILLEADPNGTWLLNQLMGEAFQAGKQVSVEKAKAEGIQLGRQQLDNLLYNINVVLKRPNNDVDIESLHNDLIMALNWSGKMEK
jgi:hypothetical protein